MNEDKQISFGDNVSVRQTPETQAAGLAGLSGNVYGETTPSSTNVEVIGELKEDYAINVHFEKLGESFWFSQDLLEFIDHAPGTEITDRIDRLQDGIGFQCVVIVFERHGCLCYAE